MIRVTITETVKFDPPREHAPGKVVVEADVAVGLNVSRDGDPVPGWNNPDGIDVRWRVLVHRLRKDGSLAEHTPTWNTVYRHHDMPPALDHETRRQMLLDIGWQAEHLVDDKWAKHIHDRIEREVAP